MTYCKLDENKNIIETGNVRKLVLNCTNPTLLSEDELKALNVYLVEFTPLNINEWETRGKELYSYNSELDKVIGTYEVITKSLDQFKNEKLEMLKYTHTQILSEGCDISLGFKIDCESKNVNDFSNAYNLLKLSGASGLPIIDYDNNTHNLSKLDFETLLMELGAYVTKQLFDKQKLRELVINEINHERINSVFWRTPVYDSDMMEVLSYDYNSVL